MDTIIYLYHSREENSFVTEKWQEKEYCLIRLGIPASLWQNLKALEKSLEEEKEREKQQRARGLFHRFDKGNRKRKQQTAEQTGRIEQEKLRPLLEELSEQQTALCLLGDNPHWTYCVYEDFLWDKIDTMLWREYWRIPVFCEYHDYIWAEELMQYAVRDTLLILGYAPCVGQLLRKHAVKLRSVRWILKPEQYTEAVQDFQDEFYEEYGMVIAIQVLEPGEEWVRVRPSAVTPVNILDFSGEEKLSACDVIQGSVWLDMDSLEGKERRMEGRSPQISYFSLKKQWAHLDTIGKNRYNT